MHLKILLKNIYTLEFFNNLQMGGLNFASFLSFISRQIIFTWNKNPWVQSVSRFNLVPFFLFHSRAFHVKIKLLRKNRLVVDRHLFLQSRQFRLYKRFYFVQRTEADAKSRGRKFDREASLSFIPFSSFLALSSCVLRPVASFNPAAYLISRYIGGEAEVHAVHRQRVRNEGCRLGHGVDFLLPESQQSALLPPIVTRAHST